MNTKKENKKVVCKTDEKSDVARREEETLAFWNEHDVFNKSIEKEAPQGDFVFYDGPPFATGLPHYGHILAGTIKDAIPRFWTMNGYRVRRKWGWDCHGLPLENIIEKRLGLATKRDIEAYGVKNFNEAARSAVLEYADDWRKIVPRMGRWVDMTHDYKTMDSTYTESVWWIFSELNKKGFVYEGFKTMHLCPRCGTTLSNFEVNLGYKDIKDISVFVALPLVEDPQTALLVWTTTPWTLPGNMAAAVHEEYDYVVVEKKDADVGDVTKFIVAKDRLQAVFGDVDYTVVAEMKGAELVGKSYIPPFDYFKDRAIDGKENAWKIYHAPYVELGDEGTGAVHLAPAYGEEDMELAKAHGVPIVHHVDTDGHFLDFVTDFAVQLVKPKDDDDAGVTHLDADIEIVKALQQSGRLFKKQNITHSYPHCWRCDTPLLNYATTSWFVEVTKIKDKLVTENNKIKWVPSHIGKNRFGKWLEGARDWAVSRQRYWGAPLPIWRNVDTKEYKIMGSLSDLKKHVRHSGNTYYTVRHGESESNAKGVSCTNIDVPNALTANGVEQVRDVASALTEKNIDFIIASPFQRTKETAEIIRKALGFTEEQVIFDARLGEIQLGEFDGQSMDMYHNFLDSGAKWCDCAPMDGESWQDVMCRIGAFLYDIDSKYEGKNILIISHNSPLRMLGAVNDGTVLSSREFDDDQDGKRYENAEIRELPFVPMPHNDKYELDYHRPYIDDIELFDDDDTKLERVPDVFDCWFESGSMPYAQHHYPFENKNSFEKERFPAQFIAEGLDQTRGWFYSLIVLGTALFDKSPYENVIVNGLVLAEDGKKMSKKLQNYPDPMELADKTGVDAIRFYLLSSPIVKGEDLNFSEKGVVEVQRKNLGRLHNVLAMYEQYASDAVIAKSDSEHVLDRWIVARVHELTRIVTEGFKMYELDKTTRPITDFIDDLSVWYLRRSRERLKGDRIEDKTLALGTLRYVLKTLALVMAPTMPFYAEYLWGRVKNIDDVLSVHLATWPEVSSGTDEALFAKMDVARLVVSKALEIRAKIGIKVRQPLQKLTYAKFPDSDITDLHSIIAEEVNIKEVIEGLNTAETVVLETNITPALQAEGDARDFMRAVQDLRKQSGLESQDTIVLTVQTSKKGEAVLADFREEIQKTIGASEIIFAETEGVEVSAGEHSFKISFVKS